MVTGVALVDDYARSCALPGCGVAIHNVPGRPERRYCNPAHRAAARHARRAAMQPEQRARLVETLPWLAEPEPESAPPPAPPDRPHRRRGALALIGVLGAVVGGYAITSSEPAGPAPAPAKAAPEANPADQWAARAEVTLTSVDRQLDVISRTEQAWNSSVARRPGIAAPAPVAALQERRAVLERRRAALSSQLDTYRALGRTRSDLEAAEQRLDAAEDALRTASTTAAPTSPDDTTALAVLREQHDMRARQLDAKRAELAGLEGNVEHAARTPLPDDGEATTEVSALVMDAIHGGGADGRHAGKRQATPTPPHRRRPRDVPAERRPARAEGPRQGPAPLSRADTRRDEPVAGPSGERKVDPTGMAGGSAHRARTTAHHLPARRPTPRPRGNPAVDDHRMSPGPDARGAGTDTVSSGRAGSGGRVHGGAHHAAPAAGKSGSTASGFGGHGPRKAGTARSTGEKSTSAKSGGGGSTSTTPGRGRHGDDDPTPKKSASARSGRTGHPAVTKSDHKHTERSSSKAEGKGSPATGSPSKPARSTRDSGCSDGSGTRETVASANR